MKTDMPLLVFTDLDGTLLDHETYQWAAAHPALAALKQMSAGIVMASSKTAAEITALQRELGLEEWPAIVENGAGILSADTAQIVGTETYDAVRSVLAEIPAQLRGGFCGFGDMTTAEVAHLSGLTHEAASRAKQRAFSEPGLWQGAPQDKAAFLAALADKGVSARQGGRFLTLSFGQTKADQMARIIQHYQPRHTVALGDAPNDVEMLEAADFGVIVANPHRPPLPALKGEADGRIMRTKDAGPSGWNAAILDLITRLGINRD